MPMTRRELLWAVLGTAALGRWGLSSAEAPANAAADAAQLLDPQLREIWAQLRQKYGSTDITARTLAQARSRSWASARLAAPAVEELRIAGRHGAPDVRCYVINAAAGASRAAILHLHGGGFVTGTASDSVPLLQRLALELGCVIVTVDYRLAPETPFPGSLEDNYAALLWLQQSARRLGADVRRIAVLGESAGGGHAAMLALAARDRGEVSIAMQVLIYPMLDDRTGSARSLLAHQRLYTWTAASNRFGWTSLLGVPAGSGHTPAGAVPARAVSLAGLPRTFIGAGAIDLFADEDLDYARRLVAAGVPTECVLVPGAFHGFDLIAPEADCSVRFRAAWSGALARGLAPRVG